MISNSIQLGKSDINISPMGLGTMQWGDIKLINDSDELVDKNVREMFTATIDAGINFFDTAEIYGNGKSEIHLGKCLKQITENAIVATKFMPFPWRLSKGELKSALRNSLDRLGLTCVDLYQIHWPFPPISINSWMDAMADVVREGLVRAVGVSNYSPNQTMIAYEQLAKHQIPLASNQVKYNLLDRRIEMNGLLDLCKKMNISLIAYSPLEKGILTDKYTANNLPKGFRSWRYNKYTMMRIQPLMQGLKEIGNAHRTNSPAKVALKWVMCKGAIPIPGARSEKQAQENVGALTIELSDEEVDKLDLLSEQVK